MRQADRRDDKQALRADRRPEPPASWRPWATTSRLATPWGSRSNSLRKCYQSPCSHYGLDARGRALAIGAAWLFGVVFSCLATHATVATAISSIERRGTWKMEVRTNAKTELASVEQQLAALSRPAPPRPMKTVREGLAATSVPPAIWKDSQECAEIQGSSYFARACAQVVQLRRELAASEDYGRLTMRAGEIRKALAEAPILATADPLPMAFSATFGRFVPIGGMDGVALLLTTLPELISGFGLAALIALYSPEISLGLQGRQREPPLRLGCQRPY